MRSVTTFNALPVRRLAALWGACVLTALLMSPATAQSVSDRAEVVRVGTLEAPAQWRALSSQQREVLQPLAGQWHQLDNTAREKWLNVADRYQHLPPAEQDRLRDRMARWSGMQALERGEARLRFQQSRQLPAQERQRKWAEYQSLSAEKREALARRAKRAAQPVELPRNMAGPREAKQLYSSPQWPNTSQRPHQKSNVAPRKPTDGRPAPMIVAPAVVKAGPGATTRLLTQPPAPPAHQQPGMPKINRTGPFNAGAQAPHSPRPGMANQPAAQQGKHPIAHPKR